MWAGDDSRQALYQRHNPINHHNTAVAACKPDQKAFADWGVKVLPTSFLIDAGGRVRSRALGAIEWDEPEAMAVVEGLVRESSAGH